MGISDNLSLIFFGNFYSHTDTFKILNVLNSSHGVWVIPFLEFLFMYNSVLPNNFDFASLLMNLLVLVSNTWRFILKFSLDTA